MNSQADNTVTMEAVTMETATETGHTISTRNTYNPNRLLDALIEQLNLKNDAALARTLEVAPPMISKIRHHALPVGGAMLIRMHEISDLTIAELRMLMGDRRKQFRISDKQFKPNK
jgi:plasmid maintenance system antidote protein VapI